MDHAEILHRCFRCGYCKFPDDYTDLNCPAYLKFRFETYSPGGRMWLLRGLLNGDLQPTPRLQEILFSCATCGNCVARCAMPGFKDLLLEVFTAGKELLVQAGKVPPSVRDYLTPLLEHGNPFKMPAKKRAAWSEEIDVAPYTDQEYLLYIGDVGSYTDQGQAMARAVALLLHRLGVSFGILGAREISDGNDARAMGEKDLADELSRRNMETIRACGVQKVITLSPHGYHAIKNACAAEVSDIRVFQYVQVLARKIGGAAFAATPETPVPVCYHDPCYLGRHNHDYQAARTVLLAIPGIRLVEMDRNRQNALCCGGGGGNFFTDILGGGSDAPARIRVREAAATGAQILAVACPICANMFDDAIKVEGLEQQLAVQDIAAIALERLER